MDNRVAVGENAVYVRGSCRKVRSEKNMPKHATGSYIDASYWVEGEVSVWTMRQSSFDA